MVVKKPPCIIYTMPTTAVRVEMDEVLSKGVLVMELLTRGKAIHARCVDCVGFHLQEVRQCSEKDCPLYAYRTGLAMKDKPAGTPIRSKAIKNYCIECMGTIREVRQCMAKGCPLYRYRMGRKE